MASEVSQPPSRQLLLATDLSGRCDRALDRAAILASECSAQLTIVHAYEPDVYALTRDPRPSPSWRKEPNLKHAIAIKQLHQDLGDLDVPFHLVLGEGDPADIILKAAEDLSGDLIITGIARGETFGRYLFGGTVERLVRKAAVPVLVVKARARKPYRDIVVATDFSTASRRAIDAAEKLFPNASITLLHCYDWTRSTMTGSNSGIEAARQVAMGQYREFIDGDPQTAKRLGEMPVFIERGSIDSVLQAYMADKNLDLVIFGSQGKGPLTRLLVGSTAEEAMASAPTDVLVITSASSV